MRAQTLPTVTRRLLVGLDVLVAGLVIVAVLRPADSAQQWATLVAAAAFAALYATGRATIRVHEAPLDAGRGRWWPAGAWIAALIVVWTILLQVSDGALWLAFPLMLLQMHVLGPRAGVLAVVVTTVVAAVDGMLQRAPTDTSIAPALGPAVGAAVAVAVTLGLEALVRESQERQRMLEELARARDDVAAAERETAVATERERLAREIHDTLAQGYSAIELLLRAAARAVGHDDARAHAYIDQARSTAQENLAEARRFVRALAPADLDGATLVAALHRIADRTQAAAVTAPVADDEPRDTAPGSLVVRVQTSGEPRALPLQVEAALVRIAQSALANVVQHAAARNATLSLTFLSDEVILDVVDDGRGFDPGRQPPPDRPGGFGLTAMRSRAREFGGSLTIETGPGDGTVVAVRIPDHDEDETGQVPPTRAPQHQEDR